LISFVYCITNLINEKRYVGKANDPVGRWRDHLKTVRNPDSCCFAIHHAMRKHGIENFRFEIVAECDSEEAAFETERRLIREWSTMEHGYNLNEGGQGGCNPTSETREKISAAHKGRPKSVATRKKMSEWQKGRTFSAETRAKISDAQRGKIRVESDETKRLRAEAQRRRAARGDHGFQGRKHTEEAKEKMRLARERRKLLVVEETSQCRS